MIRSLTRMGTLSIECTKYPLNRELAATETDAFDEHSRFDQLLSAEDDSDALLDKAHAHVLERIGGKARVRVYTGSDTFREATVLALYKRLYRRRKGEDARELYERYSEALKEAIDHLQGYAPRDTDQDGVIEARERISMKTGRIFRGG